MGPSEQARTPHRWLRSPALLLVVVGLAALALSACDPPPPNGSDLGIEVLEAPTDLAPGEEVAVTARVTNHGTAVAPSVLYGAVAPSTTTVADVSGPQVGACALRTGAAVCDLGDLAAGATATVELTLTGAAEGPTEDLVLSARSDASEPDPDPHANSAVTPLTVGTGATVDLQVQGEHPAQVAPGATFTSRSWVTNRSGSAAAEVVVTQTAPAGATIVASRFERSLPGGGTAIGSCAVAAQAVTCTPDGALVEPTAVPDQRWRLEVDLSIAAPGSFEVLHSVSSPHPEPAPDPGPNTVLRTGTVVSGWIFFDEVPPVEVGEVFDVTGVAVAPTPVVGYYVSVSLPPNLEAVSVTSGATTTPCDPDGTCDSLLPGVADGYAVSMRLRAVSAGHPGTVGLSISTIGFGIGGHASVHVIDPTITSEVHPELDAVDDGVVGVPQTVTGTVWNTGASDHPEVTATVDVGPSVTIDDARWGPAGLPCTVAGSVATCGPGGVPAYGSAEVLLQVTPTAAGPVTVDMTTTSTTAQDAPDPVADTDSVGFDVLDAYVDLGLTAAVSHDPAVEGELWQFNPTVRNHGTISATGVQLVATIPAGVDITSAYLSAPVPPGAGGCSVDGQTVTCDVGALPAGQSQRVQIHSMVTAGTTGTLEVAVAADQTEPIPDPNPNELTHGLTVLPPRADVYARIVNPPNVVWAGQPTTFRPQVRNLGPSDVPSATGTFEVPPGWTITSATWDDFGTDVPCAVVGTTATCDIGGITDLSFRSMAVTVVPDAPATGAVVTATASSPLPDDDPSNDEVTHTVDVQAPTVDLGLAARYAATAPIGSTYDIFLDVDNDGPAPAADVAISATLPASMVVESIATGTTGYACEVVAQALTCDHPLAPTGTQTVRLRVHDTAVGTESFTVTATTSTPEPADVLPNSVQVTRTVTPVQARITGSVRDTGGSYVISGTVSVHRASDGAQVASQAVSNGGYSIAVPPGQYQVRYAATLPGNLQSEWYEDQPSRATATVFTAADLGEVFVADAVLAPIERTTIQGQVLDGDGQPVAGVNVSAYRPTDGVIGAFRTTTAADGTYSLTVPDGEYKLRFGPSADSGLVAEWYDDQATRAAATTLVASAWGQVIVADAELAAIP